MLRAFALYEEGTLVDAELLQVSGMRIHRARHYFTPASRSPRALRLSPHAAWLAAASLSRVRSLSLSLFLVTVAHTCIFADRRTRASRIGNVRCSRLSRSSLFVSHSFVHSLSLSRTFPLSLSSSLSHSAPSLAAPLPSTFILSLSLYYLSLSAFLPRPLLLSQYV